MDKSTILIGGATAAAIGLFLYKFGLPSPSLPIYDESESYLGAIDVGTGSTRFLIFNSKGVQIASHSIDLTQYFPSHEEHEQNPLEYIEASLKCIEIACKKSRIPKTLFKGIGISNQRETIIAWNKQTGQPFHNAIIWDDARTAEICHELQNLKIDFRSKTGLPISTYFSASKILWLIRNISAVRKNLSENNCLFGTVETWMIYNLTKDKRYVTDISNASRTLLMNLRGFWDEEILNALEIPINSLPEIVSSAEVYGYMKAGYLEGVPICGSLGDQQSALLGHQCVEAGSAKNTYGTGAFLLMSTGNDIIQSSSGLLTTVYGKFRPDGPIYYALEGSVENAGSVIKWALNKLRLFESFAELEAQARTVADSDGVVCVSALSGLFAPHWRPDARGVIIGLTQHTTRAHILRALLEGICFRTKEVIDALLSDTPYKLNKLCVDGGMTKNALFLEIQANILGVQLELPIEKDLTALGAAFAAGLGCGVYSSLEDIQKLNKNIEKIVDFNWDEQKRNQKISLWNKTIPKTFND